LERGVSLGKVKPVDVQLQGDHLPVGEDYGVYHGLNLVIFFIVSILTHKKITARLQTHATGTYSKPVLSVPQTSA